MKELHISNFFELKQEHVVKIANAIIDSRRSDSKMMIMVDYSEKGFLYIRSLILTKVKNPESFTIPLRDPDFYAMILLRAKNIERDTEKEYNQLINTLMESTK